MDTVAAQVGTATLRVLGEAAAAPWWWYARGLRAVLAWGGRTLRGWRRAVGLGLWARSLFVPMYGQDDWQGRIISFAMRLVILMGRLLELSLGAVAVLIAILAYLALPIVAIAQVIRGFLG